METCYDMFLFNKILVLKNRKFIAKKAWTKMFMILLCIFKLSFCAPN